ncbi:MAG: hypothetical protein FWC61_04700 [Proteobacteria bacterium]|nr:hypothetical protein [Pseudomonadota bacterium]
MLKIFKTLFKKQFNYDSAPVFYHGSNKKIFWKVRPSKGNGELYAFDNFFPAARWVRGGSGTSLKIPRISNNKNVDFDEINIYKKNIVISYVYEIQSRDFYLDEKNALNSSDGKAFISNKAQKIKKRHALTPTILAENNLPTRTMKDNKKYKTAINKLKSIRDEMMLSLTEPKKFTESEQLFYKTLNEYTEKL